MSVRHRPVLSAQSGGAVPHSALCLTDACRTTLAIDRFSVGRGWPNGLLSGRAHCTLHRQLATAGSPQRSAVPTPHSTGSSLRRPVHKGRRSNSTLHRQLATPASPQRSLVQLHTPQAARYAGQSTKVGSPTPHSTECCRGSFHRAHLVLGDTRASAASLFYERSPASRKGHQTQI